MHDLIIPEHMLPGTLTDLEICDALQFAENEKAASTRRSYASDWKGFSIWCHARGICPMPASAGAVAAYISALATKGRKASSIGRACASISDKHRAAGLESPVNHPGVRATLRGIRRVIGSKVDKKSAATGAIVMKMLDVCPNTLLGLRDKAMLSLGIAGAMRRSELASLLVSDLVEVADGYRITIRKSKTDQEGRGQEVSIPHGSRIRPVEAVRTWLEASSIVEGPLLRPVHRGSLLRPWAMRGADIARVIKLRAQQAGLDQRVFSGHSLRAGFVTSAAESGAGVLKIQEQSRHQSLDVLAGYVRSTNRFKDHAGSGFL